MENVNNTVNKLTEMLANVISERDKLKENNEKLSGDKALLIEALENILNQERVNNSYADTCSFIKSIAREALNNIKK